MSRREPQSDSSKNMGRFIGTREIKNARIHTLAARVGCSRCNCRGHHGAFAQKKYDTGATDTEIKIGNIMPYSGPASAYGTIGKTEAAYFKKINDEGGINGRKINFISYDDGYARRRRSSRRASWSRATRCC